MVDILTLAGSTRTGSLNRKLIHIAAGMAEEQGVDVTRIDLREYDLPLYDGDRERGQGLPGVVRELQDVFDRHDAFLIASPEYNGGVPGVLKNVIDWVSRPTEERPPEHVFTDKVAGIMSAAPGRLGGLRGLYHLRWVLTSINVIVVPQQYAVNHARDAFAGDGLNEEHRPGVERVVDRTVTVAEKLHA